MKTRVYVTARRDLDGRLRGFVANAETHATLAFSAPIDPPHIDVAKARAAELFREHTDAWHLIDEPEHA